MQGRLLTREWLQRQQQPDGQRVPNSPLPLVALIQFRLLIPSFLFGHLKQCRRKGVEAGATAKRGKDAGNARRMGRCVAWRRLQERPAVVAGVLVARAHRFVLSAAAAPA